MSVALRTAVVGDYWREVVGGGFNDGAEVIGGLLVWVLY